MEPLADDLLRGADAISRFLYGADEPKRKRQRRLYHLAQKEGNLPLFRMGGILCARKSKLLEWFDRQEESGGR